MGKIFEIFAKSNRYGVPEQATSVIIVSQSQSPNFCVFAHYNYLHWKYGVCDEREKLRGKMSLQEELPNKIFKNNSFVKE